jgi:hypothetical protein
MTETVWVYCTPAGNGLHNLVSLHRTEEGAWAAADARGDEHPYIEGIEPQE